MPRIDFYILDDQDESRRQVYLCRLVDKAYRKGNRVWIHVPVAERAAALDERLWTFAQESFVPHDRIEQQGEDSAVVLGDGRAPEAEWDLLVNEGSEVPEFLGRFARVAEVINQAPEVRRRGRERYAWYRDQGYDLHHHRVS